MQIGQNQGVLERFGQKDNQGITLPLNSHSKSLQLYLIVCSCTCDLFLENLYFLWNIRKNHHIWWFSLELLAGFEPATFSLGSWHSTAELYPFPHQEIELTNPKSKGRETQGHYSWTTWIGAGLSFRTITGMKWK